MKLLIILLLVSEIFALSSLDKISKALNIKKEVMQKIIKIESDFNKYSANLQLRTDKIKIILKKHNIKYKYSKYYNKRLKEYLYMFSITIDKKKKAKKFYKILKIYEKHYLDEIVTYDLGIAMINRTNFPRYGVDEKEYYLNPNFNLLLGGTILNDCYEIFKTTPETIECYNKGPSKSKFDYLYYKRYQNATI